MTNAKRIISWLLSLIMIMTTFPAGVFAAPSPAMVCVTAEESVTPSDDASVSEYDGTLSQDHTSPEIYVGGVGMADGEYLAVDANMPTTEKPDGGYAYWKDNTLTLHNYTYTGIGYHDTINSGNSKSRVIIYVYKLHDNANEMSLILEGENVLAVDTTEADLLEAEVDGIRLIYPSLTVSGSGSLTIRDPFDGIWIDQPLNITDGNITVLNAQDDGISTFFGMTLTDGTVNLTAKHGIWSSRAIQLDGGNLNIRGTADGIYSDIYPTTGINVNGGVHKIVGDEYGISILNRININGGRLELISANTDAENDDAYYALKTETFTIADSVKVQASTEADGELGEFEAENLTDYDYILFEEYMASVTTTENEITYYSDLESAITEAMANEGSKITLLKNITLSEQQLVRDFNNANSLTIDLNGFTLYRSSGNALYLGGKTKLTITDSKSTGKLAGTINMNNTSELMLVGVAVEASTTGIEVNNTSKLTIDANSSVIATNSFGKALDTETGTTTIVNGTLKGGSNSQNEVLYNGGTLDFSAHANPEGIRIKPNSAPLAISAVSLPADYGCYDTASNTLVTADETTSQVTIKKIIPVYTVTFNANGGTCETASAQTVDGKLSELPIPTRSDYRFNGWFDAAEGGNAVTTDNVYSANTTIYAQWTQKQATEISQDTQIFVYDKKAKEFAIIGNVTDDFTVTYQQNGNDVIPENAGNYDVIITRNEDDIYKKFEIKLENALIIEKANAIITITDDITQIEKTYGEAFVLPEAESNFGTVIVDKTVDDMLNAGAYTVTYTVADDDNYNGDKKVISVTINPKKITGATVGDFEPLTYTGDAQTPNAAVTIDELAVTGVWSDVINVTDTTTFTAYGNFEGTIENQITGMLKAASSVTTVPDVNTLTYNGEAQELITAGAASGGTIYYSLDNDTWTDTLPKEGEAISYKVWYKVIGDDNHNDTDAVSLDVTIAKATPVQNPEKLTTARVRKRKTLADATVTSGEFFAVDGETVLEGTFSWIDATETISEDTTKTMRFTPINTNYAEVLFDVEVDSYISGGGGGGGVTTNTVSYTVTFETNGASNIASVTVSKNSKVTEPKAPEKEGFTFGGWYTDEELTQKYDFNKAVTKDFTLYAKWTEDKADDTDDKTDTPDTPVWENPFTDVKADDWYYEDVEYAVKNGLFNGTTESTFAPNEIITRAMMVTVLYRAEGEPEVTGESSFEDVDSGAYYAKAVIWGQQNGIINGYSEIQFAPSDNITREQIAAIMHRYAQYKGYDVSVGENTNILSYDDFADISEYAISSMQYACGSGLMKGKTTSTINPKDIATRAEIAAILHRFIEANK